VERGFGGYTRIFTDFFDKKRKTDFNKNMNSPFEQLATMATGNNSNKNNIDEDHKRISRFNHFRKNRQLYF